MRALHLRSFTLVALVATVACADAPRSRESDAGATFLEPDVSTLGELPTDGVVGFDVPSDAIGFTLTVRGNGGAARILDLVDPSNVAVRQGQRVLPSTTLRSNPGTTATASVPAGGETTDGPIAAGHWSARIVAPPGSTGHLRIQRTADGLVHGGTVDVHVHVPRGLTIDTPGPAHAIAEDAMESDPAISARLDAFYQQLHAVFGLDRGKVIFHGTDPEWSTFTTKDFVEKLPGLCVGTGPSPGFHVLLTRHNPNLIPAGGTVNVPAAVTDGDCSTSVTFLALMDPEEASRRSISDIVAYEANTLVHELGHAAGLFHTTETSGSDFDPILDTPECPGATSETAASCPDVDDVMFPSQVFGPRSSASPLQRRVVAASALVRPFARAR